MKNLFKFATLSLCMFFFIGCTADLDKLSNRLDKIEDRVETLEALCKQMNSQMESLQSVIKALEGNEFITAIEPIVNEEGDTVGYKITFSESGEVEIYHGKDGVDGQDGKDGYTPEIGVKADTDGIYYWTLDGDWITDEDGNKIPVSGNDGQDGQDGQDGVTPQLKIEDDYWWMSLDGGMNWTKLGKATGEDGADGVDGDSFFEEVYEQDGYVYFKLTSGETFVIPIMEDGKSFDIAFTYEPGTEVVVGESVEIPYSVKGADKYTTVKATVEDGNENWTAAVNPVDSATGVITVNNVSADLETGVIMVFAYNGAGNTIEKALILEGVPVPAPALTVTVDTVKITADGGAGTITYEVENPVEGAVVTAAAEEGIDWITDFNCETSGTVTFNVAANELEETRTATVTLTYTYGEDKTQTATVIVSQEGFAPTYDYEFAPASDKVTGLYYGDLDGANMLYAIHFNNAATAERPYSFQTKQPYYVLALQAPAPTDLENILLPTGTYTAESGDPTGITAGDFKILKINTEAMNMNTSEKRYATTFFVGQGGYYGVFLDNGTLSVSYEGGNYTIEGIFTDLNGETHHLTYTGPITFANEVEEPVISTLTEDINLDYSGCMPTIMWYSDLETPGVKKYTMTLTDPTYANYTQYRLVFYLPESNTMEDGIIAGTYEINDSGEPMTCPIGTIVEGQYSYNYVGCWIENRQNVYPNTLAGPMMGGNIVVERDGDNYKFTINSYDDHADPYTITGVIEANNPFYFDYTGYL